MRSNQSKSTLIILELRFNRHFWSEFVAEIHRNSRDNSKSRSEFEVRFEFGPRIIEFDRKSVFFNLIQRFSIEFDDFRLNNQHLIDLIRLKDRIYIENRSIYIKNRSILYRNRYHRRDLNLEIRIDVNLRSNSDQDFDSKSSIRFADPNRISLPHTDKRYKTARYTYRAIHNARL